MTILFFGVVVCVLMVLFPPQWHYSYGSGGAGARDADTRLGRAAEYMPMLTQTYGFIGREDRGIRYGLLSTQFIVVAVVTGGLLFAFRNNKTSEPIEQR